MPLFKDTFRSRGYRHFDSPLSRRAAESIVTNPRRVAEHSFHPFIYREVVTQKFQHSTGKKTEKIRPICFASHADSAIYTWYGGILAEKYEAMLALSKYAAAPLAYRKFPNKSCNIHFAADAFAFVQKNRPCVALCFDIKGFFDNIALHGLKAT